MKKLIAILIFLTATTTGQAQKKSQNVYADEKGNPKIYGFPFRDGGLGVMGDTATKWIAMANAGFLPNQHFDNYLFLTGAKKAVLFAWVPRGEEKKYRYNIIQDDSIYLASDAILPAKPESVRGNSGAMINLGQFAVENRKLTVEIYKATERYQVNTLSVYSKEIKPAVIRGAALKVTNLTRGEIEDPLKDGSGFKIHDGKETAQGIRLVVDRAEPAFIYYVYVKNTTTGKIFPLPNNLQYMYIINKPFIRISELNIDASFFDEAGNYEIAVIPKINGNAFTDKAATFHFTVLKPDMVYSLQFVLWVLLAVAGLVAAAFTLIHSHNKAKLAEQAEQKEIAQVQLSAVRSQLNPHFLFNALSGIQNLMNKNDVDQANRYLTKFARLTRNVLKSNELISIADEIALLDDYLQMEQLRFGFNYHIEFDKTLGIANAEIPAMLLQPFVENAVKHGVADMGVDGKINISIIKRGQDIELLITDNGKGFDTEKESAGLGLALSKKRITLLNRIYKESPVFMEIQSDRKHTTVKITLTRWL
jgi:two-component system LytT family sensor kinase